MDKQFILMAKNTTWNIKDNFQSLILLYFQVFFSSCHVCNARYLQQFYLIICHNLALFLFLTLHLVYFYMFMDCMKFLLNANKHKQQQNQNNDRNNARILLLLTRMTKRRINQKKKIVLCLVNLDACHSRKEKRLSTTASNVLNWESRI